MNTLLLSFALLFWGWNTHLLPFSIILILGIESHRALKVRGDFTRKDYSHATDLCIIILLGLLIHGFLADEDPLIYKITRQLPVILYPVIMAQLFSQRGLIDVTAFSLLGRKLAIRRPIYFDLSIPYLFACLIGAGIDLYHVRWYAIGIGIILLGVARSIRPTRTPRPQWILLLLLTGGISIAGALILRQTHAKLLELSSDFMQGRVDPRETSTSLGEIGYQKMSNRILFRAQPDQPLVLPLLLREASYNQYQGHSWYAVRGNKGSVPRAGPDTWLLGKTPAANQPTQSLYIEQRIKKGDAILLMPASTFSINSLPAGSMITNRMGTVSIQDTATALLNYQLHFSEGSSLDSQPDDADLSIPKEELAAVLSIVEELQLQALPPREAINKLAHFFDTEFSYTLEREGRGKRHTPLAHFLMDRRAGHCEFFATASTLILRACTIPTRYTIGYALMEYSPLEQRFIIRERHGHAWTRVWVDGRWEDLDTTSSNWLDLEEAQRTFPFLWITDTAAYLRQQLSRLRWNHEDYLTHVTVALLVLLLLLIANRVRKHKRTRPIKKKSTAQKHARSQHEQDSAFAELEKELTKKGYPRATGEPLTEWLSRVESSAPNALDFEQLHQLIDLHYMHRFSEGPLSKEQQQTLTAGIKKSAQSLR